MGLLDLTAAEIATAKALGWIGPLFTSQDLVDQSSLEKIVNKGIADGYAALDSSAEVPVSQIPLIGPTKGGTGISTYSPGDILYANAENSLAVISGRSENSPAVLTQIGVDNTPGSPTWSPATGTGSPVLSDAPTLSGTVIAESLTLSETLTLSGNPQNALEATPKQYVDSLFSETPGLNTWKNTVRVATTEVLPDLTYDNALGTLTGNSDGIITSVDAVTLFVGDRVLVKDQVSKIQNGIYVVSSLGSVSSPFVLTRSNDADSNSEVLSGMAMNVSEGSVNQRRSYALLTYNPIILGTTDLIFDVQSGGSSLEALDTISNSTTSTAYVLIPGMTLSPSAGSFLALFNMIVTPSASNIIGTIALFKNGIVIPETEMPFRATGGALQTSSFHKFVISNGTDVFDIRWKTSIGTISAEHKAFSMIKV